MQQRKPGRAAGLSTVHPDAAGIDIGATMHVVAVPADRDATPVRTFRSYTADLHALATWLQSLGITTVAMESTGVYWIPLFEVLEARGLEVRLVNARAVKHVPGRKTDVQDAQWLQQLHQYGLLRGSFRPRDQIVRLRAYVRERERLIATAASHIQHMQKALTQMNVQLAQVVSDISGTTGLAIIRAIVAGERDPRVLATHRDPRCQASIEEIGAALTGHYQPEHVFALRLALARYEFDHGQVADCDREIATVLRDLTAQRPTPALPLPAPRRRRRTKHAAAGDVRGALYRLLGVDVTQIEALGPETVLRLVAECGDDLGAWPSAKHFTSWLCLAPANKITGGRRLSSRTRKTASRAAALLRLAAVSVGRTQTALGAFYRRLAARVGKAKAVTATARKLAVLFYNAVRFGMTYRDPGVSAYEARFRQRVMRNLQRRAKEFGLRLVPETADGVS
jgi:transposase